jgi:hypothetical protein
MSVYIHGDNIATKLRQVKGDDNLGHLKEIEKKYLAWRKKIDALKGKRKSADIAKLVDALNEYKNFIDQPKFRKEKGNLNGFTSQSKLHSTVLEEFMYHLLIEIPQLLGKHLEFGATHAYSNLYFSPASLDSFETKSGLSINTKDQDFAISKKVQLATSLPPNEAKEQHIIHVPVVSIECKTYLDKTMYEGSVATAEKIKRGNPYSLFLIVTETYEVASNVDPAYSEINQIYVLRKQSNRETKKPIQADIVEDLYRNVEQHLSSSWRDVNAKIKSGKLI